MCFSLTYVRPQTQEPVPFTFDPTAGAAATVVHCANRIFSSFPGAPRPLRGHATRFSGGISQVSGEAPRSARALRGSLALALDTVQTTLTTRRYSIQRTIP